VRPARDTVADPDYVTAEASRDRLGLANQAGSLSLALDAADTIQAQDGLEKMLVHQMAVLHYGMMRATARMNEELDAAAASDKRDLTAGELEIANAVRHRSGHGLSMVGEGHAVTTARATIWDHRHHTNLVRIA
jgi:hypothetical protein